MSTQALAPTDPKILERIQAELGETTKIVGQIALTAEGFKAFQARADAQLAGINDRLSARKAVMGPQGTEGQADGHRISMHDIMLNIARTRGAHIKGPKWSQYLLNNCSSSCPPLRWPAG